MKIQKIFTDYNEVERIKNEIKVDGGPEIDDIFEDEDEEQTSECKMATKVIKSDPLLKISTHQKDILQQQIVLKKG